MKLLLDTDILIDIFKKNIYPPIALHEHTVAISVITYGELLYGILKQSDTKITNQFVQLLQGTKLNIEPITEAVMQMMIENQIKLEQLGKRLDDNDLLIAATAVTHDYTLLTRNTKHFQRIPDLKIFKNK